MLAYLSNRNPDAAITLLPEESKRDPYMSLGSHPILSSEFGKASALNSMKIAG